MKEPKLGKNTLSNSKATDALTKAVGEWQYAQIDAIYVYDNFWTRSRELWNEVQKATWDNVSLAADMKKELTEVSERVFNSKDVNKLKRKRFITFPKKLCGAIAGITQGCSFAYMQEAFVATLLVIARHHVDTHGDKACDGGGGNVGGNDDDLGDYEFWRIMKEQVKIPRSDMGTAILVCSDTELETEDRPFARLAGAGKSTVWSLPHAQGCPPADFWNGDRAHVVDRGDRSTPYELSAALPVNRVALVNSAAFQYEWTV
ncbi:hypothetical protein B0A49_08547 [Cryomyces minteri]|uniref:Uncharacterized protein n=1 Tax=Cryomyces minteri TaxID=331657 RepID=A0A4U0WZY7_9PEZI|nr:hypothetical protein B0A49_08547 [Cryomyces minteri]